MKAVLKQKQKKSKEELLELLGRLEKQEEKENKEFVSKYNSALKLRKKFQHMRTNFSLKQRHKRVNSYNGPLPKSKHIIESLSASDSYFDTSFSKKPVSFISVQKIKPEAFIVATHSGLLKKRARPTLNNLKQDFDSKSPGLKNGKDDAKPPLPPIAKEVML